MSTDALSKGDSVGEDPEIAREAMEAELRKLENELATLHSLNNDVIEGNEEKDAVMTQKEEQIKLLESAQEDEIHQMELELTVIRERSEWEILERKTKLERLQRQKSRYLELAQEGRSVEEGISSILYDHAVAGRRHATAMHESNINIKDIRRHMEEQFRKELGDMDQKYQNEAFNSLKDAQKKELLMNAKLKDEVGLQSIGLANMGVRLIREKMGYDASKAAIEKLEALASELRDETDNLRQKSRVYDSDIEINEAHVTRIRQEHDIMNKKLGYWPDDDEVVAAIELCLAETEELKCDAKMWAARLADCQVIREDVKPITSLSGVKDSNKLTAGGGLVSPSVTSIVSAEEARKRPKFDIQIIQDLMQADLTFHEATAEFMSKFPLTLCGNGAADLDCNVLVWLLQQLHRVWTAPRSEDGSLVIDSANVGQTGAMENAEDSVVTKGDFDDVEASTEAALDALIEGSLQFDTAGHGDTWLKLVGVPSRLPPPETEWMNDKEGPLTLKKSSSPTRTRPLGGSPVRKPKVSGIEEVKVPQSRILDEVRPPIAKERVASKAYLDIMKTQKLLDKLQKSANFEGDEASDIGSASLGSLGSGSVAPSEMARRDPMVKNGGRSVGMRPSQSMSALNNKKNKKNPREQVSGARRGSRNLAQTTSAALLATIQQAHAQLDGSSRRSRSGASVDGHST